MGHLFKDRGPVRRDYDALHQYAQVNWHVVANFCPRRNRDLLARLYGAFGKIKNNTPYLALVFKLAALLERTMARIGRVISYLFRSGIDIVNVTQVNLPLKTSF